MALIEWKYTERYRGQLSGGPAAFATRMARYEPLWSLPDRPLHDLVPYEALFFEPFYQLMRLQLLAWRMELAQELGAEVVRVVIVAPARNWALSHSFSHAQQRPAGFEDLSVHSVWAAMHLAGEGGVLEQTTMLDETAVAGLPEGFIEQVTSQIEDLAEAARRLRAEEIAELLGVAASQSQ